MFVHPSAMESIDRAIPIAAYEVHGRRRDEQHEIVFAWISSEQNANSIKHLVFPWL